MFYYLIDLHYSQTPQKKSNAPFWFYYLIDLHYSQTAEKLDKLLNGFTTL